MRQAIKRYGWMRRLGLAGLIACFLAAAAPADAFSLRGLQNRMVDFLLRQISTPGSFEVLAETVDETAEGDTSLRGVTVADGDGVWMTIDTVAFSWSPSRLLRGEVEIGRLTVAGLDMTRAPTPLPDEEPEEEESRDEKTILGGFSFDWPRSPIALRIDRMTLERIHIAEGVAPQEIMFDATGGARDEGDVQSLRLSLRRTDDVEGVVDLRYERTFSDNRLQLSLTAREAPGGMVAAAASLEADANTRVNLTADGPPEDWRVALDANVDGMIEAKGEAAISYAGKLATEAEFLFIPGFKLGEPALVALSPAASVKINAAERADGVIDIETAEIAAPSLRVEADGTWNRPTGELDLALTLSAERTLAALADGVDFAGVDFEGKATGTTEDLALKGEFILAGLTTDTADVARLDLDAAVRRSGERIEVDGFGLAEGLRVDQLQPEILGPARLTLKAALDGDAASVSSLKLDSKALTVTAKGGADLAAESFDVRYQLKAPDLAPVAGAYNMNAGGVFAATGTASGTFSAPAVDGRLELTEAEIEGASLGALAVDHKIALGEALGADIVAALRGSDFGDADLKLDAKLQGDVLEASYEVAAPDLAPAGEAVGTPLAGALSASGQANGPLDALEVTGDARIENAAAAGNGLGRVSLTHAVALAEAISGDVKLTVEESDFGNAEAASDFELAGETLTVEAFNATGLGLNASAAATVNLSTTMADAKLTAAGDLSELGRLLGTPMAGALDLSAEAAALDGRQNAQLTATLDQFSTEGAAVRDLDLTASGSDLLGEASVTANLRGADIEAGGAAIKTVTFDADGPLSALKLALDAAGELEEKPISAELEALADLSGETVQAEISTFAAALDEERAALDSPLTITSGAGTTTIEGLDLGLPDNARLAGDATLYPNGASGDLELAGLSMELLTRLDVHVLDRGVIGATAEFDTRSGSAGADISIKGEGLSAEGALNTAGRAMDFTADADWDGRLANLDFVATGPYKRPLTLKASLPLRPTGGLAPAPPRGAQIDAALDWRGEIANLWSLVPATGHILRGETDIALTVTGPVEEPKIGGSATVTDGAYENLDLGTILTDLDVKTTIAEGRAIGLTLSASDGAGGTVEGRASVKLAGADEGLDVEVSTNSATLVRRDDVTARLQGGVAIKGPFNDLLIKGEIEIEGAEVRLVNSAPPGVATLGEVEIKGEDLEEEEVADPNVITLDMRVFSERKVFVRGRGLDSEWKMDLAIEGDAGDPQIVGSVERVRGGLDLLGKRFELERGAATFTGAADPGLDVMLTRETDDFTGRIVVTGTGSEPTIAFTSDPVVPEEEVLPMALFGRSSQSLSAAEGLQLALGVATLMNGGDGAVGDIRGALGVDVLNLGTDDDGEQEVNVGRYVSEGVYVGAKQSLGGSSSVVVEIDILDNLTVDAETGASVGESVGVNWRYDF